MIMTMDSKFQQNEKDRLRTLAEELATYAERKQNEEKKAAWRALNDLESYRPLLWINEIPWKEMDVNGELTCQCEHPLARQIEQSFLRTLYQLRHMPDDTVVEPVCHVRPVVHNTGFGIRQQGDNIVSQDSGVTAQHFERQIFTLDDVQKIKDPQLSVDWSQSQRNLQLVQESIGDILRVEMGGVGHQWFALWDTLIRWYGVEAALLDLVMNPELVHAAMQRLLEAHLAMLEQQIELNLLILDNNNSRIGSGGLGYTSQLPQADFNGQVRPCDQWGCANAQILAAVSPAMHEEFALTYDRQWLKRFGLTYYGCCEPLDNKISILRAIPNLRKISISPWAKVERVIEEVGTDYVISWKPSPAVLAQDNWHPELVRQEIANFLDMTRGLHTEIILKDISTTRVQPSRLWEWAEIASEEIQRRYPH
ncbi:MAG: hypothetical protein D6820_15765 [Lentisphaerae bacterium]|nr:MAG: hypothetical protein D6820_15765 [Lentisphaerota bacterium]